MEGICLMKNKGIVFSLVTMLISGVAIFANGQLVKGMDPIVQTTIKNSMVGLLVVAWMLAHKKISLFKTLSLASWLKLLVIAMVGGSVAFGLFFTGLKQTGAVDGTLIHKSMILWIALMALPLLKEKVSKGMWLSVLGLYATNFINGSWFSTFGVGHLMILAATLLWSVETIMIKKYASDISVDLLVFGRMVLGSVFLGAYMLLSGKAALVSSITLVQWQGLAITGALLFGYVMTWYRAIRVAPVTLVSSVLVGATVITSSLTMITSGSMGLTQLIQAVLIASIISSLLMTFWRMSRPQSVVADTQV